MNKADIKEVLSALGATTFKDSGESIMTNCPLAKWTHESGQDRRPSFGVKEEQGMSVVHCFTCGFKGGLMTLVRQYAYYAKEEGLLNDNAVKQILDFIIVAEDEEIESTQELIEIPKPPESITKSIGQWHEYFEKRGIDQDTFDMWELGYYDLDERIIFPVFDEAKRDPVGIVGRAVDDDVPVKYRNYPAKFKKSAYLYGLWLKNKTQTNIVVVEGPIDAIIVNRHLINSEHHNDYWCVALLGSEPSKTQLDLLVDNADEVICVLDNDPSGKRGQKEIIDSIAKRIMVSLVEYPDGVHDPDSAGEQIIDMIMSRTSVLEHKIMKILNKAGD